MKNKHNKPVAKHGNVREVRESIDMANKLMRSGVAFVCVPYFSSEQKAIASLMAAQNVHSIYFDGEENE